MSAYSAYSLRNDSINNSIMKTAEKLWCELISSRSLKRKETKIDYMLNRLDERLALIESDRKEYAVKFLLANLDSEPITDKDTKVFYGNVYDEWLKNN